MLLRIVFLIAAIGFVAWVLYVFVSSYLEASGDRWTRVWLAFKASKTIIWAQFIQLIGALGVILTTVTDWSGIPGFSNILSRYMTQENVLFAMAVFGFITEMLRRYRSKDS